MNSILLLMADENIRWEESPFGDWYQDMPPFVSVQKLTTRQAYKMARIWLEYFRDGQDQTDYLRHLIYLLWAVRKQYIHPTRRRANATMYELFHAEKYKQTLLDLIYEDDKK